MSLFYGWIKKKEKKKSQQNVGGGIRCDAHLLFTKLLRKNPPATSSARSATGCVVHGLGFLPTTSHTRDDEIRRIDGSVHDAKIGNFQLAFCNNLYKSTRLQRTKWHYINALYLSDTRECIFPSVHSKILKHRKPEVLKSSIAVGSSRLCIGLGLAYTEQHCRWLNTLWNVYNRYNVYTRNAPRGEYCIVSLLTCFRFGDNFIIIIITISSFIIFTKFTKRLHNYCNYVTRTCD